MTNPIMKIVNATTGEEIERELNAAELAQWEADEAAIQAEIEAQAAAQALKDSANSKLAALGLTPDEIAAITGA